MTSFDFSVTVCAWCGMTERVRPCSSCDKPACYECTHLLKNGCRHKQFRPIQHWEWTEIMRYELWDIETGNRVYQFATMEAVLDAVRECIKDYGPESREVLSLCLNDTETMVDTDLVLCGEKLVKAAQDAARQ